MYDDNLLSVMSLHALVYCPRLFYLEEVERIRIADDRVYAGRTLHLETLFKDEDINEWTSIELSSEDLGLIGKADAARRKNGTWIPYEHKKGKALLKGGKHYAFDPDIIQVAAYAMLLEKHLQNPVEVGRIHYHGSNVTISVPINEKTRQSVIECIELATRLKESVKRPDICDNDKKCLHCSLAPECLPEEQRLSEETSWEPLRLFPAERSGSVIHFIGHDIKLRKAGNSLTLEQDGKIVQKYPVSQVSGIVFHGYGQATTQALHYCAYQGINIHWLSNSGRYLAGVTNGASGVQKRIRQYQALSDQDLCLNLARVLVEAKCDSQLKYILRLTRGSDRSTELQKSIRTIRNCIKDTANASDINSLRGFEGAVAREYFKTIPSLLKEKAQPEMGFNGRSRRPPQDRFNALLSFGYTLLYQSVLSAIYTVGLEPALGFYHQPRSSGHPLVLDLMEIFRLPIWDIAVIGSINRGQWDPNEDFVVTSNSVWLSKQGKAKAIKLYEDRLTDQWKHPVTQYSLSYERLIELEVRLLEKEWSGESNLFAKARIR